jgi:hypothetical protein
MEGHSRLDSLVDDGRNEFCAAFQGCNPRYWPSLPFIQPRVVQPTVKTSVDLLGFHAKGGLQIAPRRKDVTFDRFFPNPGMESGFPDGSSAPPGRTV